MTHRMLNEPVVDDSAWTGTTLRAARSWEYHLNAQHLEDLDRAADAIRAQGLELVNITRDTFPLGSLATLVEVIRNDLTGGRGFSLLRGFPVETYDIAELEKLYWGLCTHVGTGITQNGQAGLIHYVTDGKRQPRQGTRGVGMPKESKLHVDLTDCVSLLCVQQAPDQPPSRVASSAALHNALLRQRPGDLPRLYEGFQWDRMGEHAQCELPTTGYSVPFFSYAEGQLSCRYNRAWITRAADRLECPFSDAENDLLDHVDHLNREQCLEFPFEAGDIQFCNNYLAFHGRAAHEVIPDERNKRLLLRIWVDFDAPRAFSDEAIMRYGVVRHGALGWTVNDVVDGLHRGIHARNADGRPRVDKSLPST